MAFLSLANGAVRKRKTVATAIAPGSINPLTTTASSDSLKNRGMRTGLPSLVSPRAGSRAARDRDASISSKIVAVSERPRFESRYVEVVAGSLRLRIHYLHSPAARAAAVPLVFVPGLGASGRTMLPTARLMPAEREVFIVDPPSHGKSQRPKRRLDLDDFAAVTDAWLEILGLERAVLVGHSFGSQIAVQVAVDRPAIVERLALISPTVDAHERTIPRQLVRLALDGTREPFRLLLILLDDYLRTGFRGMRDLGRAAIKDQVEHKLPSIEELTLLVRGGRDPMVPERWVEEMAALLSRPALVVVPEGTHALQYQSADAVAEALTSFLGAPSNEGSA